MGKTVVHGNFEWDEEKNKANIENHGMSFEEILPMFDDPLFWEQYDSEHSKVDETRYFGTAKINGFAVVGASYIVNLRCVQSMLETTLEMSNGDRIPVPRRLRAELKKQYFDFYTREATKT